MSTRTMALALALSALTACSVEDGSAGADTDTGGKADTVGVDAADCTLDPSAPRTLTQFVNNEHVQFRCRGPGGQFVQTGCCAEEIDDFQFATGCPLQAKFNDAPGSQKRCVQDFPDAGESVSGELFVATLCCQMLCDSAARWDDATTQNTCRDSAGRFHPHVCCMMNDDLRCGGAQFDATADDAGFRQCRARQGDFAGQLAPAACCVDTCFGIIEQGEEDVPLECLIPLEDECSGARNDGNGICRAPDGRFAKGLCCLGQEALDVQRSDDCYLAEFSGRDLAELGCE
jgi:hypothetical protein